MHATTYRFAEVPRSRAVGFIARRLPMSLEPASGLVDHQLIIFWKSSARLPPAIPTEMNIRWIVLAFTVSLWPR
jgi:hypothetical protein